jgi:hypothetical protein
VLGHRKPAQHVGATAAHHLPSRKREGGEPITIYITPKELGTRVLGSAVRELASQTAWAIPHSYLLADTPGWS